MWREERQLLQKENLDQSPSKVTVTNPPLPQAPLKPTVREDTPWPGTGEMLGDLFKERDWLVRKGYLAMQNKEENIDINSLKEEPKVIDNSKRDKCRWGPNCPFCKAQEKKEGDLQQRPLPSPQTQKQTKTQITTTMGSGDGKT